MNARPALALCLITAFLTFVAPRPASADTSLSSPAIRAAIDAAVAKNRAIYGGRSPIPGVLVAVYNSTGSYVKAYGFADLKTQRPLTTKDHFRIGSNTKTFVISVLLQLVDEGYLSLDDPLSKFSLGVTIPNGKNITVRELCQMRSGLFEAYDLPILDKMDITGTTKFDPRNLVRLATAMKPLFPPGTKYNYSNTNYLILGLIIESLTHDTVAHQVQIRLLDRFGLKNTFYPSTPAMPEPWAHGYGLDAKKNWEDVSGTIPVSLTSSAGAMISNMEDSLRWVKLYVTGKTNGAATQRQRLDCKYVGASNVYFGLGIGCTGGWYGYTGGLPGYNTSNFYLPKNGTTILAWVTVQNDVPSPGASNALFHDIAKIVTPKNIPVAAKPVKEAPKKR